MDTAEMRLLTVPQFARRVSCSVDEVIALIQNRDVKALRPDPEGGYRVLETEVDRLLQEKTRIKRQPAAAASTEEHSRTVPMETHLGLVTSLEATKAENARLERLNCTLQAELFQYLRVAEENSRDLMEVRSLLESAHQRLVICEAQRQEAESQWLEEQRLKTEAQSQVPVKRNWWQRLTGR